MRATFQLPPDVLQARRQLHCARVRRPTDRQQARLEGKFLNFTRPVLDEESCRQVLELVDSLDKLPDLSPLAGSLATQPDQKRRH